MHNILSGETRLIYIVGDPIAQVRSPAAVTELLMARGYNAVVVPAHVSPDHLTVWLAGVSRAKNVDGIIVAVPHKFACFELCRTASERSNFVGGVSAMRRSLDGSWHGHLLDGEGFLEAMHTHGHSLTNKRVLLVGAGGMGFAVGYALVHAHIAELAIHDIDTKQRDTAVQRLQSLHRTPVRSGNRNPQGFDIIVDATPALKQTPASVPIDTARLRAGMVVVSIKSPPEITPLIESAQQQDCVTVTGTDIFHSTRELLVDFLLTPPDFDASLSAPISLASL
jgi:shikimate dehydrogenase